MAKLNDSTYEINAIEYLYNFINTELALTFEEQMILSEINPKFMTDKNFLKEMNKKQCRICGLIKDISEFYPRHRVCKKCYNDKRYKK